MTVALITLGFLGLCLGSFVNALVWRIRQQDKLARIQNPESRIQKKGSIRPSSFSILHGRSQCPKCGHQLAAIDLIPVLSWLFLRACCRYCHKPIVWQYPLVELTMAAVFMGSLVFWPGGVHTPADWIQLSTWLAVSVGLLALLVYDLRWLLLPNRLIYSTLLVAVLGRLLYIGSFESRPWRALAVWVLSVAVASGFFWLIFQFSKGQWIGYGDVRLGLILGTLLSDPLRSALMIGLAAILGALAVLPLLATGRQSLSSKVPFGPFLIVATGLVVLFGDQFLSWYRRITGV